MQGHMEVLSYLNKEVSTNYSDYFFHSVPETSDSGSLKNTCWSESYFCLAPTWFRNHFLKILTFLIQTWFSFYLGVQPLTSPPAQALMQYCSNTVWMDPAAALRREGMCPDHAQGLALLLLALL